MSEQFSVKFISDTVGADGMVAEELVAYTARVSNPSNQMNMETAPKLIAYLINNKHWSPLEMASMCVEIKTSRGISPQILRHWSFSFQEFSQRYAKVTEFVTYPARRQDKKNRQNSIDDLPEETKLWFLDAQKQVQELAQKLYVEALDKEIAKEQARFLLPLGTATTMYMAGNLRDWLHYIVLRTEHGTQLEHAQIAEACQKIFVQRYPSISKALGWLHE